MLNIHGLTGFRRGARSASGMATAAGILALGTAGTAAAGYGDVEQKYTIKPSDSIQVVIVCPDGMFLNQTDYSSKTRHVPQGIEVIEGATGVGVSLLPGPFGSTHGPFSNATGTATNWDPTQSQDVIIRAHCR